MTIDNDTIKKIEQMRKDGHTIKTIAHTFHCNERIVRLKTKHIKSIKTQKHLGIKVGICTHCKRKYLRKELHATRIGLLCSDCYEKWKIERDIKFKNL